MKFASIAVAVLLYKPCIASPEKAAQLEFHRCDNAGAPLKTGNNVQKIIYKC